MSLEQEDFHEIRHSHLQKYLDTMVQEMDAFEQANWPQSLFRVAGTYSKMYTMP